MNVIADGQTRINTTNSGAGGGAGGAIKMEIQNIVSGTLSATADGGNGSSSTINFGGGGGGGGTVDVKYCTGSIGTTTASGGSAGSNTAAGDSSTAGSDGAVTVSKSNSHDFCPI